MISEIMFYSGHDLSYNPAPNTTLTVHIINVGERNRTLDEILADWNYKDSCRTPKREPGKRGRAFFSKPFDNRVLLGAVREALAY